MFTLGKRYGEAKGGKMREQRWNIIYWGELRDREHLSGVSLAILTYHIQEYVKVLIFALFWLQFSRAHSANSRWRRYGPRMEL